MARAADLPGAAHLVLAEGVVHLDPASAVFEAMLEGWARQQRTRFLKWDSTIKPRLSLVRRLADVLQPVPVGVAAGGGGGLHRPSAGEQPELHRLDRRVSIRTRCGCSATSSAIGRYGWLAMCQDRFGAGADADPARAQQHHPRHRVRGPAGPAAVDLRRGAGAVRRGRRQGGRDPKAAAQRRADRDAGLGASQNGLRLRSSPPGGVGLDVADFRRNPKAPDYGRYGALFVRFGKSSNGSPPKRRTVFTVPEMDWIVGVLDHYLTEVRPRFGVGGHPAFWVTERCGRLSKRGVNEAFETAREAADLPAELDLHSLRHCMITHLVEFDYPERFVQDQAGHATASSTAIYTGVSDEYRNQLLRRKLTERHRGLWEDDQP